MYCSTDSLPRKRAVILVLSDEVSCVVSAEAAASDDSVLDASAVETAAEELSVDEDDEVVVVEPHPARIDAPIVAVRSATNSFFFILSPLLIQEYKSVVFYLVSGRISF
jgi:hypothetical protein